MEIRLNISSDKNICLNMSHHHVLQGFVYRLMSADSRYSGFIHDKGYSLNNRWFKGFVFGKLEGRYRVSGKRIQFEPEVCLTIRSPSHRLIMAIAKGASKSEILHLGENRVMVTSFRVTKTPYFGETVCIQTLSPITTHVAGDRDGKPYTNYLSPFEDSFYHSLEENCLRKIRAFSGDGHEDSDDGHEDSGDGREDFGDSHGASLETVEIFPHHHMNYKKYVTKFKDSIIITGWEGKFLLRGDGRAISLLYDMGLGSNNSQGFGLFKVIPFEFFDESGQYDEYPGQDPGEYRD